MNRRTRADEGKGKDKDKIRAGYLLVPGSGKQLTSVIHCSKLFGKIFQLDPSNLLRTVL